MCIMDSQAMLCDVVIPSPQIIDPPKQKCTPLEFNPRLKSETSFSMENWALLNCEAKKCTNFEKK